MNQIYDWQVNWKGYQLFINRMKIENHNSFQLNFNILNIVPNYLPVKVLGILISSINFHPHFNKTIWATYYILNINIPSQDTMNKNKEMIRVILRSSHARNRLSIGGSTHSSSSKTLVSLSAVCTCKSLSANLNNREWRKQANKVAITVKKSVAKCTMFPPL